MAELDAMVDRIIDEHYSRNLDAIACPGFGVVPTSEAIRDAFFDGLRVGCATALEDRDRLHRILYAPDGVYAVLRIECAEIDANDWPDDLHPSDVIEKHLVRAYRAALEGHDV